MRVIKRIFGAVVLAGLLCLVTAPIASAHVLLTDASGKSGAVLHVTPDDDPVAGQQSGLYYELRTPSDRPAMVVTLTIESFGRPPVDVPVQLSGQTASAAYIFPTRDIYTLKLSVLEKGTPRRVEFTYDLRVSRGAAGASSASAAPLWATFGIIGSLWALVMIALSAYYRRAEIKRR